MIFISDHDVHETMVIPCKGICIHENKTLSTKKYLKLRNTNENISYYK